jgi:hypothetical protein
MVSHGVLDRHASQQPLVPSGPAELGASEVAGLILWDDQGPDQGRSAVRYSKWTRDEAVEGDRGITTTRQEHTMVATTITAPWAPAVFTTIGAGIVTAARFVGHFLLALLGVIFLGTGTDH